MIDNKVTLRPIAGTRRRGKNNEEDIRLKNDLLSDKKELAEHLMLVDLGRNDVGQISKKGTVKVTEKKYHRVLFSCDAYCKQCNRRIKK